MLCVCRHILHCTGGPRCLNPPLTTSKFSEVSAARNVDCRPFLWWNTKSELQSFSFWRELKTVLLWTLCARKRSKLSELRLSLSSISRTKIHGITEHNKIFNANGALQHIWKQLSLIIVSFIYSLTFDLRLCLKLGVLLLMQQIT